MFIAFKVNVVDIAKKYNLKMFLKTNSNSVTLKFFFKNEYSQKQPKIELKFSI